MDALTAAVEQALGAGEYERLPELLDEAELADPEAFESLAWPHSVHLLAHIHAFRLEDARFLNKRLPAAARAADPALATALALLQRLWARDYPAAWATLAAAAWPAPLQGLAASLGERLHARVLALVERAYADIPPARLAALLGCSEAEAAAAAAARGWEADAARATIVVRRAPAAAALPATAADLRRLAEHVAALE